MSLIMLLSVSNANGLNHQFNSALYFCRRSATAWLAVWHSRYSSGSELLNMQQAVNTDYGQWSCCDFTDNIHHNAGSTFSLIPSDDLFKIQFKFWNRPLLKLSKFKAFGGWLSLSLELPPATGTTCVRSHKRTEKGRNLSYKLHGWYQWISGFCKIFTKPTMVYP